MLNGANRELRNAWALVAAAVVLTLRRKAGLAVEDSGLASMHDEKACVSMFDESRR